MMISGKRVEGIINLIQFNLIQFLFLSITGQNQLIPLKWIVTIQCMTDMGLAFKNYVDQTLPNFNHFWIYDSEMGFVESQSTYKEPDSQSEQTSMHRSMQPK